MDSLKNKALITVLIPSYNHGHVLENQISSLLNQGGEIKLVVLNDGSTDNTEEIFKKYRNEPSILFISNQSNQGLHKSVQVLLTYVDTPYFCIAAADDLLLPEWSTRLMQLIGKYPDAKMIISNTYILKGEFLLRTNSIPAGKGKVDGYFSAGQYAKKIVQTGRFAPSNTVLMHSDLIQSNVLPIYQNETLNTMSDVLMISECAARFPVAYTVVPLGVFSVSSNSFGNSSFNKNEVKKLLREIASYQGRMNSFPEELYQVILNYVSYTWSKHIYLRSIEIMPSKSFLKALRSRIVKNLFFMYLMWRYKRLRYLTESPSTIIVSKAVLEQLNFPMSGVKIFGGEKK